jgi:hypothetical protein
VSAVKGKRKKKSFSFSKRDVSHRRTYETIRIFDKFQVRCPPPTPSTKSLF